MDFNRRLYTWAELNESAEAMAMIDGLLRSTRRAMQRYVSLSAVEWDTMLETMNMNGTDFGHRFVYDEYLGGLCHVQFSCLPGEKFLFLSPICAEFPWLEAIDRVAMRSNGVMCTLAPEAVSAMWRVAMENNTTRLHLGESTPNPIGHHGACAFCLRRGGVLLHCTCGLLRYCNRECQSAHWRFGHKALCEWTMSCLLAFGTNQLTE